MQRRKTRTRPSEVGAALLAALVLAGCGGGEERRAAPQPKLPREVASHLAERSDLVATALDDGEGCRALAEAQRLQQDAIHAINDLRVPGEFQEHLGSAANDLVSRIECTRAADADDGGNDDAPAPVGLPPRDDTPAAGARNLSAWLRRHSG